jgi:hypothetical protein
MGYIAVVKSSTLATLGDIAAEQWGLLTRRQAELAGVSSTTLERLTAPGSSLDRVAFGVYRLTGAPVPEHMELRAAWLQLAPDILAWQRTGNQGVVSHRSAATVYGLGHLATEVYEFTVPARRQTRRPDVKLHLRPLGDHEWITLGGLPVTRPSRIAADLLREHEDPEAIAQIVAEATRRNSDYPGTFAEALAPYAARFGMRRGDGLAVLAWFLDMVKAPEADVWMNEARASVARDVTDRAPATP